VLERIDPVLHHEVRRIEHQPHTKITVTPDMVTFHEWDEECEHDPSCKADDETRRKETSNG
ncbi:hypothetical protein LCGC14_1587680, partial [marine sediment metagenome]